MIKVAIKKVVRFLHYFVVSLKESKVSPYLKEELDTAYKHITIELENIHRLIAVKKITKLRKNGAISFILNLSFHLRTVRLEIENIQEFMSYALMQLQPHYLESHFNSSMHLQRFAQHLFKGNFPLTQKLDNDILLYDGISTLFLLSPALKIIKEIVLYKGLIVKKIIIKLSQDEVILVDPIDKCFVHIFLKSNSFAVYRPLIFYEPSEFYWWSENDEFIFLTTAGNLYAFNVGSGQITSISTDYRYNLYKNFYNFFTSFLDCKVYWVDPYRFEVVLINKESGHIEHGDWLTKETDFVHYPVHDVPYDATFSFRWGGDFLLLYSKTTLLAIQRSLSADDFEEISFAKITACKDQHIVDVLFLGEFPRRCLVISQSVENDEQQRIVLESYCLMD